MQLKNLEVGPRTILTDNGRPLLLQLALRESTTAPGRVKAMLAVAVQDNNGTDGLLPMPFAQATIAAKGSKPSGFNTEWRIELN